MNWRERLREGVAIPAHPLALTAARKLDERRQRALTRYYLAAGAGGVAVGVHTTQFEIREARFGLFKPVLELAMEELRVADTDEELVKVAGIVGRTPQAVCEAEFAARCGYDIGLLSLGAWRDASIPELLAHARAVAEVDPAVRILSPAGSRRPASALRILARIRGNTERGGHQDCAIQPIPEPGCGTRGGGFRARGRDRVCIPETTTASSRIW